MPKKQLNVLIIFVIVSLLAPSGAWGYTWFFNATTKHSYATTLTNETWEQAEAEAILAGGHLVTINDADEEIWLREKFDKLYTYWIGFTDRQEEGVWGWAGGESVTHKNWAFGEPNNLSPGTWGRSGRTTTPKEVKTTRS